MAFSLPAIVTTLPVVRNVFLISVPRTVPLPAQVLQGVQYGNVWGPSGGIEFAGTYSVGGAVYPAEDDVDVTAPAYGPTGADFAGVLEQPAEADVKTGVGYGANGTEFTGEYGGGGAAGYSRGRVVNK